MVPLGALLLVVVVDAPVLPPQPAHSSAQSTIIAPAIFVNRPIAPSSRSSLVG